MQLHGQDEQNFLTRSLTEHFKDAHAKIRERTKFLNAFSAFSAVLERKITRKHQM